MDGVLWEAGCEMEIGMNLVALLWVYLGEGLECRRTGGRRS